MNDNGTLVLAQEVVGILRDRGIEATPQDVVSWAELMVKRYRELRSVETKVNHWLESVKRDIVIPTLCLHVHFGDAIDVDLTPSKG